MGNNAGLPQCTVNNECFVDVVDAGEPRTPCNGCNGRGVISDLETILVQREETQDWFPGGSQVLLNIYHLDSNWSGANHVSKELFGVGGAFHAAIEVYGNEWSYGAEGISCSEPRSHQVHVYHESILLGETTLTAQQVRRLVTCMGSKWLGQDYNLLENNCCNFADTLSMKLVGDHVPGWVMRFPQLASKAANRLDSFVDVKGLLQQSHATRAGPMCAPDEINGYDVPGYDVPYAAVARGRCPANYLHAY
jgi:hypothetical protein